MEQFVIPIIVIAIAMVFATMTTTTSSNNNTSNISQQQQATASNTAAQPRDGPATTFQADPLIQCIESNDDNFFALVLVAGWPPDLTVMDLPYQRLLTELRTNVLLDYDNDNDNDNDATTKNDAVYLYPTQHLHVTIATLVHLERRRNDDDDDARYEKLRKDYTDMVTRMTKDPKWPTKNNNNNNNNNSNNSTSAMQLELDRIQLGTKAGILLWKETTGSMTIIRQLLVEYAKQAQLKIHSIPGIVHSTFCRFRINITATTASTASSENGDKNDDDDEKNDKSSIGGGIQLQERFQTHVVAKDPKHFFPFPISIRSVTLVNERTPYMHIPKDDRHVFFRTEL